MRYKIMRVLCMFDLPTDTGKEKKDYRYFREDLIKEGFIMLQYSIYMRTCPSREYAERLLTRIEKLSPAKGHIRLIMITEKQYEDMKIVIGCKTNTEKKVGMQRMIVL